MSTKLSVWIDNPTNENTQDATTFAADSQRVGGFVTGTPASSKRMNTALRQANLVAVALMDVLASDSNVTAQSSVEDVKAAIQAYFNKVATKDDVQSKIEVKSAVIPNSVWGYDDDGNYVATIVVDGINVASAVLVDINLLQSQGRIDTMLEFWSTVYAIEIQQNALTFYQTKSGKPDVDIPINLMVVT